MTDQAIPEEAVEAAAIALYNSNRDEEHADEFYDWPNIDSAYDWDGDADEEPAPEWARDRVRADARVVLAAAYPHLRQQARDEYAREIKKLEADARDNMRESEQDYDDDEDYWRGRMHGARFAANLAGGAARAGGTE